MAINTGDAGTGLVNGGIPVNVISEWSNTIDSIAAHQPLVETTFRDAATLTSNNSTDKTGHAGTRLFVAHINVTALTLDAATSAAFFFQRLLPDGSTYDDMALYRFTTTGTRLVIVKADLALPSTTRDTSSVSISNDTVVNGPWGDTIRQRFAWIGTTGGSESVTMTIKSWAI